MTRRVLCYVLRLTQSTPVSIYPCSGEGGGQRVVVLLHIPLSSWLQPQHCHRLEHPPDTTC